MNAARLVGVVEHPKRLADSTMIQLSGKSVDRNRSEIVRLLAEALLEIRHRTCVGIARCSYAILDTELADGASYVQFLSRDAEPALTWECASGFYGHPAIHRTTNEERRALMARGFSNGREGNHRKTIAIFDDVTALPVAEDTMAILERTMGWSPRSATTLKIVHEESAAWLDEEGDAELWSNRP